MIGAGTQFFRSDDGTTYTRVAKLMDLTPPEESRSSSEKTYLDDTTNYKTFEPGMIDPGELSLALEFDITDAGQNALKADKGIKGNKYYKIVYPDGSSDAFMGHITGWGKSISKEETIQRSVKFKVSGAITESAPA
ncbi:hypothetical protein NFHSH190041_36770 (plasmid) [Shewanella sp. NFH-SH190041]|uniref:phage tail tube protein n=1 Tax=Shewanella sp. NFH-SH190041 TaxID=2950245 RepID=UPI0021C2BA6D|nr:phage tail tube protein [Shewanella sp. NFH-SH190041]BDM66225.1 hypothetical protein NFHSH190041_36770 [Shewanella sp. NFH-SH190041]